MSRTRTPAPDGRGADGGYPLVKALVLACLLAVVGLSGGVASSAALAQTGASSGGGAAGSGGEEPPKARDDRFTSKEDRTLRVRAAGVLRNDGGTRLSAVKPSNPKHGRLSLGKNGSFVYVPDKNYSGNDSFTYAARNGAGKTSRATVRIFVKSVNDAPVAGNDGYRVEEDGTLTVPAAGVLKNDRDVDRDRLSATTVSGPQDGTLTLNRNGSFAYKPAADFEGGDVFSYEARDGKGGTDRATVTITVDGANDPPEISSVTANPARLDEGSSATVAVAATDPEGDTLSYGFDCDGDGDYTGAGDKGPQAGNEADCTFPDDGTKRVNVRASDSGGDRDTGFTEVTVDNVAPTITQVTNDGPVEEGSPVTIAVAATDPGGDALSYGFDCDDDNVYEKTGQASEPNKAQCTFPDEGSYTINVRATDGDGGENTDSTIVAVENVAPIVTAPADQASGEDEDKSFDLGSFTDPGADGPWQVTVDWGDNSTRTTFEVQEADRLQDGSFDLGSRNHAYADDGAYTVEVTVAEAGSGSPSGSKTFAVTVNNLAPTADPQSVELEEDGTRLVTLAGADPGNDPLAFRVTSLPANGKLYRGDGTSDEITAASVQNPAALGGDKVTYVPNGNYNGPDSFDFVANDGVADSNTATVGITVSAVNDAPVNTVPRDSLSTGAGQNLSVTGISVSDVDAGNNPIQTTLSVGGGTLTADTDVQDGASVSGNGTGAVTLTGTVAEINATLGAGVTYTSASGGSFTLTVETNDGGHTGSGGAKTDTDTVAIVVDSAPTVATTSPSNDATDVALDANITVNFSESVNAGAGSFEIKCPDTGATRAFTVSGSGTASITLDPNDDLPGATRCQVRVVAGQIGDADANDPPDNMAADYTFAFTTAPKAIDDDFGDDFTVTGNVRFDSADASPSFGVLDNDELGASNSTVGSAGWQGNANKTEQGGDVTARADGTFEYNPPAGYEGSDRFTYTTDGGSTATVTLRVGGMVWFVDENAGAGGDGRLSSPFATLSAFNGVNNGTGNNPATGDNVFLYESNDNYAGGVTLLGSQKLIGQDAAQSLAEIADLSPPSGSDPLPATDNGTADATRVTIVNASGNGVTLAQGNTLRGLTVGNTSASGIRGTNANSATMGTDVSVSGTNGGAAVDVSGGNGTITYAGTITTSSGRPVSVSGRSGGSVTFGGSIASTGAGISAQNNTGGTISFGGSKTLNTGSGAAVTLNNAGTVNFADGGLDIDTTSGPGFSATGGGTVKVSGPNNTISTGTGTALTVQSANIGAGASGEGGLNFKSISANGAQNGIVLQNTGNQGGLTVTGESGSGCTISTPTCTGGTIQNTTGDGVSLTNTNGPSFNHLQIKDTAGHGISGTTTSGLSLSNSLVRGAGDADNEAGLFFASANATNLTGASSITNTTVHAPADLGASIQNYGGALNLTVSGSTFSGTQRNTPGVVTGDDLVLLNADRTASGSATITASFTGSTFDDSESDGIAAFAQSGTGSGGGTMNLTVDGNTFDGNGVSETCATVGCNDSAIAARAGQQGTLRFTVQNNNVQNQRGEAIFVLAEDTSSAQGTIQSNTIGTAGIARSGSYSAQGIFVAPDGNADVVARIHNNNISSTHWQGIWAEANDGGGGTPRMDVILTSNSTPTPSQSQGTYLPSIDVQSADNANTCAKVESNIAMPGRQGTAVGSPNGPGSIDLLQAHTATFEIEGLPGPTNDASSFVKNRNPASADPVNAFATASFTGGTCRTPAVTPTP